MTEKQAIRNRILGRLKALPQTEHELQSMLVAQNAALIKAVSDAKTVMLFVPMKDEPDIWPLIDLLLVQEKTVVLPALRNGAIVPCEYRADDILVSSNYGALEPDARYAISSDTIEVVLVPGVAFDKQGHRLGRGAGHYDRFLQPLSCAKIGLCFEMQIELSLPFEEHDVMMDGICTDKQMIACNDRLAAKNIKTKR